MSDEKAEVTAIRINPEYANLIPPLSKDEFATLKADIEKRGELICPIIVDTSGNILDGHHRWQITEDWETPPPTSVRHFDSEEEKQAFIISVNINRRQLSGEQKAELRERLQRLARKLKEQGKTQDEIGQMLGVDRSTVSLWLADDISDVNPHKSNIWLDKRRTVGKDEEDEIARQVADGRPQAEIAAEHKISQGRVSQIAEKHNARKRKPAKAATPEDPEGLFKCVVFDPPWPIEKIEREERPRQGQELDYPTLSLEEIDAQCGKFLKDHADPDGCHIYLWTTHRFLPDAFNLFNSWEAKYSCLMTWVKPTGFTPFSWMYNTEHVLFGRIGSLPLLKKGMKLSFEAKIGKHSEKPDVFYERVRAASPEPRIDRYARKSREGFIVWGNEVTTCATTKTV
jgi:N6-adenosine-specific RNA methylase IME4/DNA-binding CsgD family transcriptional regulator